jgi:hypothetical protein
MPAQERIKLGKILICTGSLLLLWTLYGTRFGGTVMSPQYSTNNYYCTGVYEEMRELEGGPTRTMTPEEEEELLNYSEEEGAGADVDAEMPDPGERDETEEEARLRAERKAEEEDRNAKLAEIQERIRRRKAEKERRMDDMKRREEELRQAEQDRIRAERNRIGSKSLQLRRRGCNGCRLKNLKKN